MFILKVANLYRLRSLQEVGSCKVVNKVVVAYA
jgi:hypothetical protein